MIILTNTIPLVNKVLIRALADLHIHSTHSDGKASPKEIIYTAQYKGLNIISITDHNTFSGSIEALKYAKNLEEELVVIIGNEVRTDYGDILVYCYEPINTPHRLDILIDYAHENNCLVVPAHPFDIYRKGIGDKIFDYNEWDAIETWNASSDPRSNKKALQAAKLLGLPGLANSDAHIPDYIGCAYTIIEIEEYSIESVFKAIKQGKTHPHPGYPPFRAFFKKMFWSVKRRLES